MSQTVAPDIRQLRDRDLPRADFPGNAKNDFRIFVDPKVYDHVHKHANETTEVEICGVLVGNWGRDDNGPFVSISAAIRGEAASNKLAEVTFTHETWAKINERMDKEFSNLSIVGWYHTHPDFGIFLSDRDRFIHEHFFNEPGQVAYVVDPIKKHEGMFIWSKGAPTRSPYFWVGGDIKFIETSNEHGESSRKSPSKSSGTSESRHDADYDRERPVMGWLTLTLFGVCLLMIGYMLRDFLVAGAERQLIDEIQRDRINLVQDLARSSEMLQSAGTTLIAVGRSPQFSQQLNDPLLKQNWDVAINGLRASLAELERIRGRYRLDPQRLVDLATLLAREEAARASAVATKRNNADYKPSGIAVGEPPGKLTLDFAEV